MTRRKKNENMQSKFVSTPSVESSTSCPPPPPPPPPVPTLFASTKIESNLSESAMPSWYKKRVLS